MNRKHSVTLSGHQTSVTLEDPFWEALNAMASRHRVPIAHLIADIDRRRSPGTNLSSALRVAVLEELQMRCRDLNRDAGTKEV